MAKNGTLGVRGAGRTKARCGLARHSFVRPAFGRFGFLAAAATLAACLASPAQAEKVGVAAAVNPDAFSSLSGVPNKQLNIGKSIFYNERISTSTKGLVQVLLVDGSTFTVGPNSNLVIDKFVYNPQKKTGTIVATFSKGSMRFIGGKLSKNAGGVKVNTPEGALAIRGGMFQGNTQRKIYSFLYGHSMTFRGRNGQSQTVYQPGYTLDLSRGAGTVRPTTAEDTNVFMQALSSPSSNTASNGGNNGGSGPGPSAAQQTGTQAANISNAASQAVSDATFIEVQTAIAEQLIRLEQLKTEDPAPVPASTQPIETDTGPPPVVKNGGTFTGFASGFLQTGENGSGRPEFLVDGTSNIVLNPETNTVEGQIQVTQINRLFLPKTTTFGLGFRGEGDNAYVDDNTFLALGDDGSTTVVRNEVVGRWIKTGRRWWQRKFILENQKTNYEDVSHDGILASLPSTALCEDCDFIKFGTFASDVTYGENIDKTGGWWIASNDPVKTVGDLPQQGTALYAGNAVGTIATRGEGGWAQGVGTGSTELDWDFAKRRGNLQISNFGNKDLGVSKSFGGRVKSPAGVVGFSGNIAGNGGKGAARGTFVGPRPGLAPKGVIGDFGIAGRNWRANGVYGGRNTRSNIPSATGGN